MSFLLKSETLQVGLQVGIKNNTCFCQLTAETCTHMTRSTMLCTCLRDIQLILQ